MSPDADMSAEAPDAPAAVIPVSVRTLAAFAARTGSLHQRFTPAPTGLQGTEGHQLVYRRRPQGYRTEIALGSVVEGLLIRGRADGFCEQENRLEEIKTFYGDVDAIPGNQRQLHWAQLKLYGWLYCRQEKASEIHLTLVYLELAREQEYRFDLTLTADSLEQECLVMVGKYQTWQESRQARLRRLAGELQAMAFPFTEFGSAQREMAEAVYKSAATRRTLLIEAPTGTGKTLAALFPALKAFGQGHMDKLLYLTSKNTGKEPAVAALRHLGTSAASLRVLELSAQVNSCLAPDKACDGDLCPYARNFYDKLENARQAASQRAALDHSSLRELALEFEICPYYLGMEMSRWTDVIVADVNQFFDGAPLLVRLVQEMGWKACLLVDEAHNLVERGRMMFTATLDRATLLQAKKLSPTPLKKILDRLDRHWRALEATSGGLAYGCLPELPAGILRALDALVEAFHDDSPQRQLLGPAVAPGELRGFFFQVVQFRSVLEEFSHEDGCIELEIHADGRSSLTLKNQIPARLLAKRLAHAHSGCFFSATLQPLHYYQKMLGLPDATVTRQVSSPFASGQLQVKAYRDLSTRYRDRHASSPALASTIAGQLQNWPGNALVFVPSYAYLEILAGALQVALAGLNVELMLQDRQMSEDGRTRFVDAFRRQKNLLGVAVLGGIFGEGVDLPGDALTGVFIASLGLPPVNPASEQLQKLLQARFGDGYRYTFLYPGLQKVVQAAGRVIRRREDRGYVCLLDDRFARPDVRRLLPSWWAVETLTAFASW